MASLVAAFPAKYAAGSPGSARIRQNVTTTTPARPGAAAASRLESSLRKDARIGDVPLRAPGRGTPRSALGQLAKIQQDVNQVLVPADVLLHRHVQVELHEGQSRHVSHGHLLHLPHILRVLL